MALLAVLVVVPAILPESAGQKSRCSAWDASGNARITADLPLFFVLKPLSM
jgi:hypothetical protein